VSRSVLFTVANPNQAANALPVIERLLERGVACHAMVLDSVYHRDARPAVAHSPLAGRITLVDAPARGLDTPFARLSPIGRMNAVRALGAEVARAAGDHDAVVVGIDGPFERLVLKRYRNRKRFSAILWDALIRHQPKLGKTDVTIEAADFAWLLKEWSGLIARRTLLRAAARVGLEAYAPELSGHTPADMIYTSGRFVTLALRSQGVRGTIATTGIPRFARLATADRGTAEVQRRTALYLTSSFSWYERGTMDRCQQSDLDALADALPGFGWDLRIRVHPNDDPMRYERFEGRPGVAVSTRADTPLWNELAVAGVAVTAMSTAGLEALALGRPLLVFLGAFPAVLKEVTLGRHPQIPVARTLADVQAGLETLASLRDPGALALVLEDFIDPGTAESAQRIADSILARIQGG
jgi:hypothetical protein